MKRNRNRDAASAVSAGVCGTGPRAASRAARCARCALSTLCGNKTDASGQRPPPTDAGRR